MRNTTTSREDVSVPNHLYELLKKELRQSVINFVDDILGKEASECVIDRLKEQYPRVMDLIEEEDKKKGDAKINYAIDDDTKHEITAYCKTVLHGEHTYGRLVEAFKCGQEGCTQELAKEKAYYHRELILKQYLEGVSARRILAVQKVIEKYKRFVTIFLQEEHREQCAEFYEVGLAED